MLELAITDIHGRFDLLRAALNAAYVAYREPLRLVFLGDFGDRGPASREVIELVRQGPERQGDEWITLMGNHEELAINAVDEATEPGAPHAFGERLDHWLQNGGVELLLSYGWDGRSSSLGAALKAVPADWLRGLLLFYDTPHRLYVHAGVAPGRPFASQRKRDLLWIREAFLRASAEELPKHIVHGHTPFWAGKRPTEPELLPHRTNLDTMAYDSGLLTLGLFDPDRPGGPYRLLTAQAQDGQVRTAVRDL